MNKATIHRVSRINLIHLDWRGWRQHADTVPCCRHF